MDFDITVTNSNNFYNQHGHGRFQIPESGIYFFTWNIAVGVYQEIDLVLMKNNEIVAESFSSMGKGNYGSGFNSAVLNLQHGDDVRLQISKVRDLFYHNSELTIIVPIYSTFTGIRIS